MKPELKDVVSYQAGYDDGRRSVLESEEVKGLVKELEELIMFPLISFEGAKQALAKFQELKKKVMGNEKE